MREDVFFFEGNTHLPMEQHAAVAQWGADGKLTLWSSTQTPHYVHRALAQGPGRAAGAHPRDRGAGRRRLRRQARSVRPRDRGVQALPAHRPAGEDHADARGGLLRPPRPAPGADVGQDRLHEGRRASPACTSAPGSTAAPTAPTAWRPLLHGRAPDRHLQDPRYKFEGARVFTNKPPCGPKRGHGTPQPRFALECQIDKAAEQLGLDPADMRRRNLAEPFTKTANHLTVTTIGLGECIDRVVEASGWRRASAGKLPPGQGHRHRVLVLHHRRGHRDLLERHAALGRGRPRRPQRAAWPCSAGPPTSARARTRSWPTSWPRCSASSPKDIRVHPADTDLTPVDLGSYSSRVTLMAGNAAIQAAERLREKIFAAVGAEARGAGRSGSRPRERRVFVPDDPERGVSLRRGGRAGRERCAACWPSRAPTRRPSARASTRAAASGPRPCYSYSACVVEVDVDARPAWSTSTEVWIAHDVGPRAEPAARRGPGRGLGLHGPGRGADGGAGLPEGRAQDPVAARVQEPDHARDAGDPHDPRRDRRSRGPVRRQGGRAGAAPAGDPRGRQRGLRRGRRADRRDADHAREGGEGARLQAPGQGARASGPSGCPLFTFPRAARSSSRPSAQPAEAIAERPFAS